MRLVLLGAPGAGCSSVARAWAGTRDARVEDLGEQVARHLGVPAELALVSVGEAGYREAETALALELLTGVSQADAAASREGHAGPGTDVVVALGSGCLGQETVVQALGRARAAGVRVVALSASVRRLAARNGLNAPRSVALGNVHHAFTLMARARTERCQELAQAVVDTTDTTPEQAAALLDRV